MKLIQLKHIDKWSREYLVEECIRGSKEAQRYLFESQKAKVFAICMRYVKNEDEAYDVLNQSFLKVFDKLKQLGEASKMDAWMRRIVVNTALDYIRKDKSYRSKFVKTDKVAHLTDWEDNPDDINEWWASALKVPQERFFIEINKLPKASRLVFTLFVLDELKHKEIASKLGISVSTSRWHLSNAREILKERLITIINTEIINDQQQKKY